MAKLCFRLLTRRGTVFFGNAGNGEKLFYGSDRP